MSLKGFVGGLSSLLETGGVVLVSAFLGAGFAGYQGVEWAEEEWDGVRTEKTELVAQQFKENIQDLDLLKSQLKVMEGVRSQSERTDGIWSKNSEKWEQYTLSHIRMSESLKDGTNKFVNNLLTNDEIPEQTISTIIDTFNTAHLNTYSLDLPRSDYIYALREAQAGVGIDDVEKLSEEVKSLASEDGAGSLFLIPGAVFGFLAPFLLAGGLKSVEEKLETRERKKKKSPGN